MRRDRVLEDHDPNDLVSNHLDRHANVVEGRFSRLRERADFHVVLGWDAKFLR
jgi:hypothetical protein